MSSHTLPVPTQTQPLLLTTYHTKMGHLLPSMNLHWNVIISLNPWFTLGIALAVIHSMGLNKCMMTYVHHHSAVQSYFTAMKVLCALPIRPSLPQTLGNHWSFYWIHSFTFSRMSLMITQYVAFSHWFLSLSNMHLSFLYDFWWLNSPSFLVLNNTFPCLDVP